MSGTIRFSVMMATGLVLIAHIGVAQEFRVYTRVSDVGAEVYSKTQKRAAPPIVARSLSLFRAGKAYDYLGSVGEVIIFEPIRRRFTIMNGTTRMISTLTFDEIEQYIERAGSQMKTYIVALEKKGDTTSLKSIQSLRFQLDPIFNADYDPALDQLTLNSTHFRYVAGCVTAESTKSVDHELFDEAVRIYLNYADWTARLNYVLNPQALAPAPRLALNDVLRQGKRLPIQVDLQVDLEQSLHLRAEHKIHWNLDRKDRGDIRHWEMMLDDKTMYRVPIREYQRALLVSQLNRRR